MKFQINLATRQYVNLRPFDIGWLISTVLLLGILLLMIYQIAATAGEGRQLKAQLAGADAKGKQAGQPVAEKDWQSQQADIAYANSIIRRKTFNWLVFPDSIEAVLPDGVTITSLEPKASGELKLAGLALTFNNISKFLANMENSGLFSDVYLLSQAEQKQGKTQKGISFTITCKVKI